jgi:hypothetical protein
MITYSKLIRLIVKLAYNTKETVFEKGSDDYILKMYVKNDVTGDNIQFGILNLEKDFIDFLKSGQHSTKVPGLDDIVFYTKGSFVLSDSPENKDQLRAVDENFNYAKKATAEDILKYYETKRQNASLITVFKRTPNGNQSHDEALKYFNYWLLTKQRSQQNQATDISKQPKLGLNPTSRIKSRQVRISKLI